MDKNVSLYNELSSSAQHNEKNVEDQEKHDEQ